MVGVGILLVVAVKGAHLLVAGKFALGKIIVTDVVYLNDVRLLGLFRLSVVIVKEQILLAYHVVDQLLLV